MKYFSTLRYLFAALAFWVLANPCMAEEKFPARSITLLLGTEPGASADIPLRALAEVTSKILGQPVVVVNKAGGGSSVMLNELSTSKPDGYTLGGLNSGGIINAHMLKVRYHPVKDLDPILGYSAAHFGLVVKSDSPFKTLKDLIAYAQAHPNKIKYSSSGIGYPQHIVMVQIGEAANVKWTHVPFEGGQPAMVALLGGHVDCSSQSSAFRPYVDAGRVRLLVTYGDKRMESFPNVPTLIEEGYPFVAPSLRSIAGPKGLPKDRVKILHDAFYQGLQDPRVKKALDNFDMPVAYLNTEDCRKAIADVFESTAKIFEKIKMKK
jgi:tripartite-type tricarboxylate transporter receptor subunit TctC